MSYVSEGSLQPIGFIYITCNICKIGVRKEYKTLSGASGESYRCGLRSNICLSIFWSTFCSEKVFSPERGGFTYCAGRAKHMGAAVLLGAGQRC